MLELIACSSPQQKVEWLKSCNPQDTTWVVSDLQSKWQIQSRWLKEYGVLEKTSVLRASEVWRLMAEQIRPDLQILTTELAQTLVWNWISPMNLSWAKSPQTVPIVLRQIQLWMTVFSDPFHHEIMPQWFSEHPQSYVRWGHWFELCEKIWQRCQEQNLTMVNWLPGVLINETKASLKWEKGLVFDLGPQISQVEGQLIQNLGQTLGEHHPVQMIYPEVSWSHLMKGTLRPYETLLAKGSIGDPAWQPKVVSSYKYNRFTTQLSEVKHAIVKVRSWLDQGLKPEELMILAPDIEEYWPSLRLYAEEEGLPLVKPVVTKFAMFLELAHWLAKMRTHIQTPKSRDLEMRFFSGSEGGVTYEQFAVLFTHIYDQNDLARAQHLFAKDRKISLSEPISLFDFLVWALSLWDNAHQTLHLEKFLQVLAQEVPDSMAFTPSEWLGFFEGLMSRREVTLDSGAEQGIFCISLSSSNWLTARRAVVLNSSESALRSLENSPVNSSEAQTLQAETGYWLGTPDRQELEFEYLWLMEKDWEELHLSFPVTDFQGRVLTPSRLWVWSAFLNERLPEKCLQPDLAYWDQVQRLDEASICQTRSWPVSRTADIRFAFSRDLDFKVSSWKEQKEVRLSPSGLETFLQCPFKFAAERNLRMADLPLLDLDLDRRSKGRLMHAIFESLTEEPMLFERSDEELNEVIEQCRQKEQLQIGEERLWPVVKLEHLQLAKKFLNFERTWRLKFPHTKTMARELPVKVGWDCTEKKPTQDIHDVVVSGRLDRVDVDSHGRYAVLDYKSSLNSLTNWRSWLKNNKLQIAFYSYLLEEGMTTLPANPVVCAQYYVVKKEDRRKGFQVDDTEAELYDPSSSSHSSLNFEDKNELFKQLREKINDVVLKVKQSEFKPVPESHDLCQKCAWSGLCRAPHLS